MPSCTVVDGSLGYMPVLVSLWLGETRCVDGNETGERPDVYDWALEGGVRAGVALEGECAEEVVAIIGADVVVAVAWLDGSCVGGEFVVR